VIDIILSFWCPSSHISGTFHIFEYFFRFLEFSIYNGFMAFGVNIKSYASNYEIVGTRDLR